MLAPWIVDEIRKREGDRASERGRLHAPNPSSRQPVREGEEDQENEGSGSVPIVLDIFGNDDDDVEGNVVIVP